MSITLNGNLLELCVLALVHGEDQYGYKLTRTMKEQFGLSESSLYPVLRRLTRNGELKTYDLPYDGRMRRYYALTQSGNSTYGLLQEEWTAFCSQINALLQESEKPDEPQGEELRDGREKEEKERKTDPISKSAVSKREPGVCADGANDRKIEKKDRKGDGDDGCNG